MLQSNMYPYSLTLSIWKPLSAASENGSYCPFGKEYDIASNTWQQKGSIAYGPSSTRYTGEETGFMNPFASRLLWHSTGFVLPRK